MPKTRPITTGREVPYMGDLVTAALSGDKRTTLVALRDRLAAAIETAGDRELAPLSRQLTEVIRLLDESPDKKEVSAADDIAKRRAERRNRRRTEAETQSGS